MENIITATEYIRLKHEKDIMDNYPILFTPEAVEEAKLKFNCCSYNKRKYLRLNENGEAIEITLTEELKEAMCLVYDIFNDVGIYPIFSIDFSVDDYEKYIKAIDLVRDIRVKF